MDRTRTLCEQNFLWPLRLTLATPLWIIILGLVLCAACGLMAQAVSTGYIAVTAQAGRSSAIGLYATSFYVGGTFGGALGGIAWTIGNYAACVFLCIVMLAVIAAIVAFFWQPPVKPPMDAPIVQP